MTQSETLELIDKRLPKRWLTLEEAAKYIGMSTGHLRKNLKGEIGYIKEGKGLMFDRENLDKYMEKKMQWDV